MAVGATATNGAASRAVALVGQGAHRDDDRCGGAGPDQQAQESRPRAAAEPDAVQPDERQQGAGRMARHVGDPRIRLEVKDSAGERAHRFRDVGDGRHLTQVLVPGGEPARETALPAVDHGQRERPGARDGPGDPWQRPPRQPPRDCRSPQHGRDADDDRWDGAPADVGVPPAEDRRGVGEVVDLLRCRVDQRCDDAEVQMRDDERRDDQERGHDDRHCFPATDPHDRQPIAPSGRPV